MRNICNSKNSQRLKTVNPSCPDTGQREKINLNFYFFLKRFYKGLKGLPS